MRERCPALSFSAFGVSSMSEPELLEPGPDQVYRPASATPASALPPSSTPPAHAQRPSIAFMLSHPAHTIALGFGAGLARYAPGTVGTLWGWASFLMLTPWLHDRDWAWVMLGGLCLGVWACAITGQHMGEPDSSHMVWDEILAFWWVLWMLEPANGPTDLWSQFGAFVLFRCFDAIKVGPMAWADQRFKGHGWRGGFGVMFDDVVAAFCTLLVIAVWRF
jgi:phosphatidylglycerophosphatase A